MTCRYHDAPLVCGECGVTVETWIDGRIIEPPSHGWTGVDASYDHRARPVHRITVCGDTSSTAGTCGLPEAWHYETGPDHTFQPVERDVPCEGGPPGSTSYHDAHEDW